MFLRFSVRKSPKVVEFDHLGVALLKTVINQSNILYYSAASGPVVTRSPLIIIFVEQMIFAGSVKQMPGYINCIVGEIPFGGVVVDNPVRLLVITLNESGAHMDECLL